MHKSQILGEEGNGLDLANKWLYMGRVWIGAQCCGKMERLLERIWDGTSEIQRHIISRTQLREYEK